MTPKTLKDLTLLAKYVSLKKAVSILQTNTDMFAEDIVSDSLKEDMKALNEELFCIREDLEEVVNKHKDAFLNESDVLVVDGDPTDAFKKLYLSVIYLSGGDITGCLSFLNDLVSVSYTSLTPSEQVILSIEYTRDLVKSGSLVPQVVVLNEEGLEVGREDLDELEGDIEVTKVKLSLSDQGASLINDVIEEVLLKRATISRELTDQLSLLSMDSPSRMLN